MMVNGRPSSHLEVEFGFFFAIGLSQAPIPKRLVARFFPMFPGSLVSIFPG